MTLKAPVAEAAAWRVMHTLESLLQMFPAGGIQACDIEEFNRQTQQDLAHIRDFIVLHYHLNAREGSALWTHCREMAVPPSLRHRLELFAQTGRVFRPADELFAENSWIQVMMGQGLVPRAYHPVADLMGEAELRQFLGGLHEQVAHTVQSLPAHEAYVRRFCAAAQAKAAQAGA